MVKEARNKVIRIRLTKSENDLAEQMALNERITINELFREYTLKKAELVDTTTKLQFIEKTAKTLLQLNKYIKDTSQPEEISNLLQQVKAELMEARTLIANRSNSSDV